MLRKHVHGRYALKCWIKLVETKRLAVAAIAAGAAVQVIGAEQYVPATHQGNLEWCGDAPKRHVPKGVTDALARIPSGIATRVFGRATSYA